jgi:rhodanese-related sulfurtransferase
VFCEIALYKFKLSNIFASNRCKGQKMTLKDTISAASKGDITIIDVREMAEVQSSGQAAGALHIPLALLALKADPKSPDYDARIAAGKPVAVYCAMGGRAGMAAQTLGKLGYNATNIGGFSDWVAAGGAVQR